ncbi:fibronectin type III domain-containing protein [Clostridiaceae bacterium M8S5]|nr:fibronectin type III domain-containing protein [Clostridiaceae bacterium M8S5]
MFKYKKILTFLIITIILNSCFANYSMGANLSNNNTTPDRYYYKVYSIEYEWIETAKWKGISFGEGSHCGGYTSYYFDNKKNKYICSGTYVNKSYVQINKYYYQIRYDGKLVRYENYFRGEHDDFCISIYFKYPSENKRIEVKGNYIKTIKGDLHYPANGKHSDGYWYVRGGKVNKIPMMVNNTTDNQSISEVEGHKEVNISGSMRDEDIGDILKVYYRVDGSNYENGNQLGNITADGLEQEFNYNIDLSSLSEGTHKLYIWIEDGKNHSTQEIRNFTVDKTKPTMNQLNLARTSTSITVNCTASDAKGLATSPYRYTIGDIATDWISTHSHTFTDLSPNKEYNIKVEVKDLAGNVADATKKVYTKPEVPSINIINPTSTTLDVKINDSNPYGTAYQIVNINNNTYVNTSGEETATPTWVIPNSKIITVNNLTPLTTYTYKIKAKNDEGIATVFSSPASGTTLAPPPSVIDEVTATATSNEITINWKPVENATSYEVEADGVVTDNGINVSYTHIELLPNTEHTYRVRAKNGEVTGEWSRPITKLTLPKSSTIPTNINTLSNENSITLTWNAVGNATSYDIEVDGQIITNGNSTNYVHTGLLPNTTHCYRVRSINQAGKSEWSSEVTAKTKAGTLLIPQNITANPSKTSVEIRWKHSEGVQYQIEADGNIIDCGNNSVYIHSSLTPNTEHTYRIRSLKDGGYSDWSSLLVVTTREAVFTTPSNIKSSATDTSITISWEEVTGADGYDVKADGLIVDNGLNTSFTHEGLKPNTTHIYRIRARQGETVSEWSNAINIVNISTYVLATPKNLRAQPTETEIAVNWDIVEGADSYDIEIDNVLVKNITDTAYTITGLTPGTQKKIKVRAVNEKGTSGFTVPITAITKASSNDCVQNISALTAKNQITLMWEPIQGAVSYDIDVNGEITTNVTATNYTYENLSSNTSYEYKIKANKDDGSQGKWSKVVAIKTMPQASKAPENLIASATLNAVRLTWDGVVGAVEYEIEADNQILSVGASNSYLITGLTPNTEYSYKVRAKNPSAVGSWSQPITIRTKSSVQSYNIKGNIGEEKNLVLNATEIRDFKNYTFTITYNPEEIEIVDIASQTARRDIMLGNIVGTDIEVIQNTNGTLQFKKKSKVPVGQSYSGIINSIGLRFKTDNEVQITYTIQ